MFDLPELLFLLSALLFVAAAVIEWRKRIFDWTNFGLAVAAIGLMLAL
jgi:hypothetical protein